MSEQALDPYQLTVYGISHKTAPVQVREQLAFDEARLRQLYEQIKGHEAIEAGLVLSTCNRVEIYTVAPQPMAARDYLHQELARHLDTTETAEHFYWYEGRAALTHLVRVVSGLDSMVLGEPQIAGQVKSAYAQAVELGMDNSLLNQVAHSAFRIAKRVRTDTDIQRQPVSVPYTAVLLAEQIFGQLKSKQVLLLGAGEMGQLATQYLVERHIERIHIVNRSPEKANALAEKYSQTVSCQAHSLDQLNHLLLEADIVVTSAAARNALIDVASVKAAMKARKNRAMFFIDLAVPRNVESAVNDLMNVYVFDIDDLQQVVDDNLDERQRAARAAEKIIQEEVAALSQYLQGRDLAPVIRDLLAQFDELRRDEVEKLYKKLPELSLDSKELIEQHTESLLKKILHPTLHWLKESPDDMPPEERAGLIRRLFRLNNRNGSGSS